MTVRGPVATRGGEGAPPGEGARRWPLGVELVVLVVIAVVVAVVVRAFVAQAFFIPSASMEPQLEVGDRVLVSKLSYDLHDPHRGDVVVFDCPPKAGCPDSQSSDDAALPVRVLRSALEAVGLRQPSTEEFVKRVIALPGETVEGRGGDVYVDGRRLVEPYLSEGTATAAFDSVQIPPDALWVMGDNRANSSDSRVFGTIDDDTVVGRAFVRVWPPGRAAFL